MLQVASILSEKQRFLEIKLEIGSCLRKDSGCQIKYSLDVNFLVIVIPHQWFVTFSELVYANRGRLCMIV